MVKVIVVHSCMKCPLASVKTYNTNAHCTQTGNDIPKTGYEKSCPLPNLLEPDEKEEG